MSVFLEHTFKVYTNKYPGVKQQKDIPIIVFLKFIDLAQTELATAMADLVCAELFFAMPTCKYIKTLKTVESKITNIIKLGNIRFYKNNGIIRHDQDIENSNRVNITSEY